MPIDFSGVNLEGIDTPEENAGKQPEADLSGVDFTGVDLSGVDFSGIDLSGAVAPDAKPERKEINYNDDDSAMTRGFKAGIDQTQAIAGGAIGLLGDKLGLESVRDYGLEVYNRNMDEAGENAPETNFLDIDSVGSAANWAGYALGNAAPMLAASLLGGGIGGIAAKALTKKGIERFVKEQVENGVEREVAEATAKKMAQTAVGQGSAAGAVASSFGMSAGSIYGDTKDADVAIAHGIVAGSLDALPIIRELRKAGVGEQAVEEISESVVGEIAKQGVFEGGTEAVQTFIEQHASFWVQQNESLLANLDEVNLDEIIEAAAMGGLAGGVMGGGGAAYRKLNEKATAARDNEIGRSASDLESMLSEDAPDSGEIESAADGAIKLLGNDDVIYADEPADAKQARAEREEANRRAFEGQFSPKEQPVLEGEILGPSAELDEAQQPGIKLLGNDDVIYAEEAPDIKAKRLEREQVSREAFEGQFPAPDYERMNANIEQREVAAQQRRDASLVRDLTADIPTPVLEQVRAQGADERLAAPLYRDMLPKLAGDLIDNGGMGYITDEDGMIKGRAPSQNPDWFRNNGDIPSKGYVEKVVGKALNGDKLFSKEQRVLSAMLDAVDDERSRGNTADDLYEWESVMDLASLERAVDPSQPEVSLDSWAPDADDFFVELPDYDGGDLGQLATLWDQALVLGSTHDELKAIAESSANSEDMARGIYERIRQNIEATKADRGADRGSAEDNLAETSSDAPEIQGRADGEAGARSDAETYPQQDTPREQVESLDSQGLTTGLQFPEAESNQEPVAPEGEAFGLTLYDEADLAERAEKESTAGEAEAKAQIDRERELFSLDGGAESMAATAEKTQKPMAGDLFAGGSSIQSTQPKDFKPLTAKQAIDRALIRNEGEIDEFNALAAKRAEAGKDPFGSNIVALRNAEKAEAASTANDGDANARELAESANAFPAQAKVGEAYMRAQSRGPVTAEQASTIRDFYAGDEGMEKLKSLADSTADMSPGDRMQAVIDLAIAPEKAKAAAIDEAAAEAALSPTNDLPEPTEAQKEAGNYKKAKVRVLGREVTIENPKGSKRSGVDPDGNAWSVDMKTHYGYLNRTEGADGDHVDVFLGDNPDSEQVFVVDQVNADGSFDEHKVMVGFDSQEQAVEAYRGNYQDGWKVGPVTAMKADEFKAWLDTGDTTKPLSGEIKAGSESAPAPVLAKSGNPFKNKRAAKSAATKAGLPDAEVVPVEGGFGYLPESKPNQESKPSNNAASEPVSSAATVANQGSGALPDVLRLPKKKYLEGLLKELGIKKSSPGYALQMKKAESRYELDVDAALAEIPFEQYRELNPELPEALARKSQNELRKWRGLPLNKPDGGAAIEAREDGASVAEQKGIDSDIEARADAVIDKVFGDNTQVEDESALYAANVTGSEAQLDAMSMGEPERKAFYDYLESRPDRDDILSRLDDLAGTPWAKQAVMGALSRQAMLSYISGKKPDFDSPLTKNKNSLSTNLELLGEEGLWEYLKGRNASKGRGRKVTLKKATRDGVIGHPEKPENAVNGSFIDCDPTRGCATFCYATKGHYNYASSINKSEAVTLAAELDPVRLGNMIADEYRQSPEFKLKKALRLFDKGDLSEAWVPVIAQANKRGIRTQIFSKRPEVLRKVDSMNLRMLSIDHTNIDKAEKYPDLNVAVVYDGSDFLTDWTLKNIDRVSVILPIKKGQRVLQADEIAKLGKSKDVKRKLCPIDSGRVSLGDYTCVDCDSGGGVGCFYGSVTDKVLKAATTGVKNDDEAASLLREAQELIDSLEGEQREQLLQQLASVVSKVRAGADITAESGIETGVQEQAGEGQSRDSGVQFAEPSSSGVEINEQDGDYQEAQLSFDFSDTREGETRSASEERNLAHARSGAASMLRGLNGTVLGNALVKEFKDRSAVSLIGKPIKSTEDLSVLGQIYRNPSFETLRYIFVKDGKVVRTAGVTSRMPGSASIFPDHVGKGASDGVKWLKGMMSESGADSYYMLHNHPSGNPEPSSADLNATKFVASEVPGLVGHVIVNHTTYSTIGPAGGSKANIPLSDEVLADVERQYTSEVRKPHDLLGHKITGPESVMAMADALSNPDNILVVGRGGKGGGVKLITELSPESLKGKSKGYLIAMLKKIMRESGSKDVLIASFPANDQKVRKLVIDGIEKGIILDGLADGKSSLRNSGIGPKTNKTFGGFYRGIEVNEGDGDYVVNEAAQPFTPPPEESWAQTMIRVWQDKFQPLLNLQRAIEKRNGRLPDEQNAYMAEELFHGKVEEDLKAVEQTNVKPLTDYLAENKIDLKELDLYLMAKHASERNAYIASKREDMPDGGSGMTNAEADAILAGFDAEGKTPRLSEAADKVYAITRAQRRVFEVSGLMNPDEVAGWQEQYDFYVPLKGFAEGEKDATTPRRGRGFDIRGKESMKALGRRSMAESPTLHAIQDLTTAVIRYRKNEVGQRLLAMAEANPNQDYWQIFTNENPDMKMAEVDGVIQPVPVRNMGQLKDDYFAVKRDGVEYFIKLKDKRLHNAMQNLGPADLGKFVRYMGAATRYLSMVNTSLNPEFMVSNMARDIQTAVFNVLAEQDVEDGKIRGEALAADMVKGMPSAMKGIMRASFGKPARNDAEREIERYYRDFLADGAKTGYFDSKDIDGLEREVQQLIEISQGTTYGKFLSGKRKITDFVEKTNGAVENAIRLSAYIQARKAGEANPELGMTREQAASLAKNLTVNFNRKGEIGTLMNSLYMFTNASIQGTANFMRAIGTLDDSPLGKTLSNAYTGKKLNRAQKAAGVMMGASFALAALNRAFSEEDDDGVPFFDKVPGYVRERNLVLMKSVLGVGEPGEYWTIPLPYGYNVFYNMGDALESALNSDYQVRRDELLTGLAASFATSFNPIGWHQGGVAPSLAPSLLVPAVELDANTNFFGGPIYKENFAFGPQKADSALSFRSTKEIYKDISEWMNDATGGDTYIEGGIDVSPDTLEHLAEFALGGLYTFATRSYDSVERLLQDRDVPVRNVPFRRKVEGEVTPYADQSEFYDRVERVESLRAQRKELRGRERIEFGKKYGNELRLHESGKAARKQLSRLRRQRDRVESNESLSPKEMDERVERIERRMKRVVDRYNKRYNEAIAGD